jgi:hypothetical protein
MLAATAVFVGAAVLLGAQPATYSPVLSVGAVAEFACLICMYLLPKHGNSITAVQFIIYLGCHGLQLQQSESCCGCCTRDCVTLTACAPVRLAAAIDCNLVMCMVSRLPYEGSLVVLGELPARFYYKAHSRTHHNAIFTNCEVFGIRR